MKKIAIVIPAFNEEKTIPQILRDIKTNFKTAEVIVVDDASRDKTFRFCKDVRTIRHKKTLGVGVSVKEGIELALRFNPEAIVIIDADGEYGVGDISSLLEALETSDLVLGSRFLRKRPHMKLLNKLGNIFFTAITSILIGQKLTDAQTGLRVLRGGAARKIELSGGYTYTQEMIILASKKGLKIKEVPIRFTLRRHGKSKVAKNVFLYGIRVLPHLLGVYLKS